METLICPSPKLQNLVWCFSFPCIWRPTKWYCCFIRQINFPLALIWRHWSQAYAFKPNTLTSAFQWCGWASPYHAVSTMQVQVCLQYIYLPHIWPYVQDMSYSYPWRSPMLFSHPSIGRVLQPPLFFSATLFSSMRRDECVMFLYFSTVVPMVDNILE